MNKLDDSTVRLIGSSQVITSLKSIIKELVENSIDANATSIEVKIEGGGLDRIMVTDNGTGISENDVDYACMRHYTSKIKDFGDLERLSSYGFRGEALGSLCAVANVELTTSIEGEAVARVYQADQNGRVKLVRNVPTNTSGTSFVITNLFQNLPVRKKALMKPATRKNEVTLVNDLLLSYAVIHPQIRFSFKSDKNPTLAWAKASVPDMGKAISILFGLETMKALQHVTADSSSLPLLNSSSFSPSSLGHGSSPHHIPESSPEKEIFACQSNLDQDRTCELVDPKNDNNGPLLASKDPIIQAQAFFPSSETTAKNISRANNDRTFVYVNKRPVSIKSIYRLIRQYCPVESSRFAFVIIDFTLSPDEFDVNVTPDKTEILLHREETLLGVLELMLQKVYGARIVRYASKNGSNPDSSSPVPSPSKIQDDLVPDVPFHIETASLPPSEHNITFPKSNPIVTVVAGTPVTLLVPPPRHEQHSGGESNGPKNLRTPSLDIAPMTNSVQEESFLPSPRPHIDIEGGLNYDLSAKGGSRNLKLSSKPSAPGQGVPPLSSDSFGPSLQTHHPQASSLFSSVTPTERGIGGHLQKTNLSSSSNARSTTMGPASITDRAPPMHLGPPPQFNDSRIRDCVLSQEEIHLATHGGAPKRKQPHDAEQEQGSLLPNHIRNKKRAYDPGDDTPTSRAPPPPQASKRSPLKKNASASSLTSSPASSNSGSPSLKLLKQSASKPMTLPFVFLFDQLKEDIEDAACSQHKSSFSSTQSLSLEEAHVIGPIKMAPKDIPMSSPWIISCAGGLLFFDPHRARELILFQKLMAEHTLSIRPLDTPIVLSESRLSARHRDVLKRLSSMPVNEQAGFNLTRITDPRLASNGFTIHRQKDPPNSEDKFLIMGLAHLVVCGANVKNPSLHRSTLDAPPYGVDDLAEILDNIGPASRVDGSEGEGDDGVVHAQEALFRPEKVVAYFKAEAHRISKSNSSHLDAEEVKKLVRSVGVRNGDVTCLHGRPVFHEIGPIPE